MSAGHRLRVTIGAMTGAALVARAVGAGTGVLAARSLGPTGRGELALLLVFALVGGAVASMGLDLWTARVFAHTDDPAAVARLVRRHQTGVALLLAVATLPAVALSDLPADQVVVTAGLLWATSASMLKLGLLWGADRMRAYSTAMVVGTMAYGAAVLAIVVLDRANVTTFLLANVLGALTTAAWPLPVPPSVASAAAAPPAAHRDALRFGLPAMFGALVTMGLYRLDVLLVGLWRSTAEAGRYSVALAVAEVLWVLPNSAAQAIVPRAAAPVQRVDTARVARGLFAAMVAAAIVTVAAGWVLIPVVFGEEYRSARNALPGLAAASIAVGLWKLFSYHLLATGDAGTRVRSGLAGIVVMVAVDAVTVPRWGATGASLGALAGYVAAAALCIRAWQRRPTGDRARSDHGPTVPTDMMEPGPR